MDLLQIIALAAVQGVTEFLPISSSGHLVIVEALLRPNAPDEPEGQLALNVFLHLGTLLAVLVFYWRQLIQLLSSDRRVLWVLFVGTLPAGVVGLLIKKFAPGLATDALLSGAMLLVTGSILLFSPRVSQGNLEYRHMGWRGALAIGLAQAVAVLPGISRSGSTIVAGLCVGLRREDAATFSFLLSIPVIAGASALEGWELIQRGNLAVSTAGLAAGVAVAFLVGLIALAWLLRWLRQGRLYLFAWWCFAAGIGVIVWQLSVRSTPNPVTKPDVTTRVGQARQMNANHFHTSIYAHQLASCLAASGASTPDRQQ